MIYRKLMEKRIGLAGTEKICADLKEFFGELRFEKTLISDKITLSDMAAFAECDCIFVGEEYADLGADIIKACPKVLFTLEDIYRMVDELETFYIDKRFNGRQICVYGSKEKLTEMIVRNPNLRIDYVVLDQYPADAFEIDTIELAELRRIDKPFVIIAEDVSSANKNKFLDVGLEFGRDFHFYNPRVPNHPTSWYLKKTLMDAPQYTMPCDYATRALSVKAHGNVMACCSAVGLSMGNSLYTSIDEILHGITAQLIRLSISNRTYSFCGEMCFMFREKQYCLVNPKEIDRNPRKSIKLLEIKDFNVQLGYDRSCNLACPSCRDHRITNPEDPDEQVAMIHEEAKAMCKKHPKNIRIGNGELFFSPYYKDIVFRQYEEKEIALISNGLLFTAENWEQLEKRYDKISMEFSIDAVNEDTYRKLRGGDLAKLRKNMEFAGRLRAANKLSRLSISFVIQAENYKEMADFVKYGKSIHADFIHFMKLNSWGHIPEKDFIKMDVYDERNVNHKKFVEILRNPIFLDPHVHVDNIGNFIGKGEKKMTGLVPTMENFHRLCREKETVVFCAGEYCMRFLNRLDDGDIKHISFIVDNDAEKQGTSLYGIPVKHPEAIKKLNPKDTLVVIAVENSIPEIYGQIADMGGYAILSARILINDILSSVAVALYENQDKTTEVAALLHDETSRRIYKEAIRRRMLYGECDFSDLVVRGDAEYRVPLAYEKESPKDEIIIDCGAYNGDTLKKFAETYGPKLKKIYAFECMEESIADLSLSMTHIRNKKYYPEMVLMPYALSDHDGKMKFAKTHKPNNGSFLVDSRSYAQSALYESDYAEVDVTFLDKVIPEEEKITLIKMDIEGSEFAALHGAERIISRHKPRLAISIYHSGEDYYRIPLYLKTLVPEYKFAVRHHNKNHCDTDLYCWTEE